MQDTIPQLNTTQHVTPKNKLPHVSIAVPVYGVEKYIERCARSLFEQTYKNVEYIFIDDCSPDKSIEILEKVAENYPARMSSIRIIHNEVNKGLATTRNIAIANCSGDLVYNVDSDDYIEKETIQKLVEKQVETNADIVSAHMYINENEIDPNFIHPNYSSPNDMLLDILSQIFHHELCGRLIKKELFNHKDIKAQNGHNVGEDWLVTPKLVYYSHKIALVDDFLYHYNKTNSESYMSNILQNRCQFDEQNIATLFYLRDFFLSHNENTYVQTLNNYLIPKVYNCLFAGLEIRNKKYYDRMVGFSMKLDSDSRMKIFGNQAKSFIMSNYCLSLLLYRIKQHILSLKFHTCSKHL